MPFAVERRVKATPKGTLVPHHPGLKLFNWNKPCSLCGFAARLELNGKRYCFVDWREMDKKK